MKAIIFDIDDTLYNFSKASDKGYDAVAAYCSEQFGWNAEYTKRRINETMCKQFNTLGLNNAAIHNRLLRYQLLLEDEGKPIHPHVHRMYDIYWGALLDSMEVSDGLFEFLEFAKDNKYDLGIATDMTAWIQYIKLERLGVIEYLDHIVTSEEAGVEKPSIGIFDLCAAKANVPNSECLMIGDNWDKDILGALGAGMKACWYVQEGRAQEFLEKKLKSSYVKEQYEAGRIIACSNYSELKKML